MRLVNPLQFKLADPGSHPLVLTGPHGERFQVSVLENDLIRVQHFPDGTPRMDRTWTVVGKDGDVPREGRARDDLSPFTLPLFNLERNADSIYIATAQLRLSINLDDFQLSWSDARGNYFASDLHGRAYPYDRASKTIYHYLERRADEHYYGFGERAGTLDKMGMRMRMLNLDALGYDAEKSDPLYKHVPFYITFLPEEQIAYGLFYDNLAPTTFDMGREIDAYYGNFRYYQADDGDLDYYLIYGPSIVEVVEKFSKLIGRPVLPPRWSLGYLGSTMSYTEADDAQEQLKKFVDLCAEHNIPCDGFHLSSGYSMSNEGKRYVFEWNYHRVPEPKKMSAHFAQAGMHLAANIKPCLLTSHPRYGQVKARGAFVRQAESDEPLVTMFWGGEGSYLDFTNPAGFDWWKARVRDALLTNGVACTWNDNNEYEIWDDAARCDGFGKPISISTARPIQTLLMSRASYEAQSEHSPNQRPYLISRSGCPGIQRYAQTWSGDNNTSWTSLRYNIPMGLGMSLSGAPNTGHDVGGFFGNAPEPELFVRWVQNGIFHPRFTIHSWHLDGTTNEPWMYPEVLPIIRDTIEFRYRLIPYLYSLLFQSSRTGSPIIRPLVYEFPNDARTHTESFDFMLGSRLLVASVLEDGARTRPVYLPGEGEWYDFYSGAKYRGGETIVADAPLERIPLFVRAGGIIPMGKVMRHFGAEPDDVRLAYVFPHSGAGQSSFTLIEDDGVTLNYQRGEFAEVTLQVIAEAHALELRADVRGNFVLPYSHIEFILPRSETRSIKSAGKIWTDEQGRRHVVVKCQR